jgi:metal-responsive CopG/Arc/MetJ family transcriptional regulator
MPMVSLQLSDDILKKFDEFQQESGYNSRSEALRGAILQFLNSISELKKLKGIKRVVVSIVYESDIDTLESISKIDHLFEDIIKLYSEYSLTKEKIKNYLVIGDVTKIKDFIEAFNKIRNIQSNFMLI